VHDAVLPDYLVQVDVICKYDYHYLVQVHAICEYDYYYLMQVHAICVHDLASFAWNNAVVFANITGPYRLNMDHHSLMPYATLWSNINLGRGRF
jgi:hypothetical protein